MAGNLCQRPRCWYYRAAEFPCLKKGGGMCFAKEGENKYHAIFGGGPSFIVHPSTMATALMAFGASLRILGPGGKARMAPLDGFFTLPADDYERENSLGRDELITEIAVPAGETRSAFVCWAISLAGVSRATMCPWFITATVSATSIASS